MYILDLEKKRRVTIKHESDKLHHSITHLYIPYKCINY